MNKFILVMVGLLLLAGCLKEEASFRRTEKIKEMQEFAESSQMRIAAYSRGGGRKGHQSWVFAGPETGQWLEIIDRFEPVDGQVKDEFFWRSNFMRLQDGHWEIGPGPEAEGRLEGTLSDGWSKGSWKDTGAGWTFVMADGRLTIEGSRPEGDIFWALLRTSYSHEIEDAAEQWAGESEVDDQGGGS